jgi:hypothetical protein
MPTTLEMPPSVVALSTQEAAIAGGSKYIKNKAVLRRLAAPCTLFSNCHSLRFKCRATLDTGCDAALEWVVSRTDNRGTSRSSIGLPGISAHHINTSVQLGRQYFNAVDTGIHGKPLFPGEAGLLGNDLLSKFRLTIDQPGNRVIFENSL